jgi:hypothetical protein
MRQGCQVTIKQRPMPARSPSKAMPRVPVCFAADLVMRPEMVHEIKLRSAHAGRVTEKSISHDELASQDEIATGLAVRHLSFIHKNYGKRAAQRATNFSIFILH